MPIKFDYTAVLRNSYLLSVSSSGVAGKQFISNTTLLIGTTVVYYQSFFNPGHQNSADWFDYYARPKWSVNDSSYRFQFRANGTTIWNTFSTGTSSNGVNGMRISGIYDSSAVALPMTVRIAAKTTAGNKMELNNNSSNFFVIRAVGSIAT